MRNRKKLNIFIIILGISIAITCSYISFNISSINNSGVIDVRRPQSSDYWSLNFIYIDNNWSATAATYAWCSGDGSWGNPYKIENVTIDATGSPTGSGIFVLNSKNDYFVINNCTAFNVASGSQNAGIRLHNTNKGSLIDNVCSNNNEIGINLNIDCYNNTISGNTANNNGIHGIRLANSCSENLILGNTVVDNAESGIRLRLGCDDNIISGNTADGSGDQGILVWGYCDNNTISNNLVINGLEHGINLQDNCFHNIISGNTVSDNVHHGILTYEVCNNNTITNNTVHNSGVHGIRIRYASMYNIITENTVSGSGDAGLLLREGSHDNIVSDNMFSDCGTIGINLRDNSDRNKILGNCFYYNQQYGAVIESGCGNNLFSLNSFIGNALHHAWDLSNSQWDNGTFGNYWDDYLGYDLLPVDGIGDIPHPFPTGKYDTKPIMNLGRDSDGDSFSDSEEANYGTNVLDASWYPMPNLEALYLSQVTAYNKTSFGIDFSITNNGIWKAEGVVIVLSCVELAITFFDNSFSPLVLDVDETKFLTINCGPIGQTGVFTLTLTVDPSNTVLETYSSKDGSLRVDAETDNSQTAFLTILSEEIEDPPVTYTPPPADMTPMVISSIAGVIGLVAIILVFTRTKSRGS